jgi:2-oxoisovalerate dehydrogenase E1 component
MLKLLRQNRIAKWFSGIGQEAISVGTTLVAEPDDVIFTMHRNLGVFTARNVPWYPLFCQLFGKRDGFTGGRERSFHFGIPEHHIIGMISHLGAMVPVADGVALAMRLRGENRVAFSFSGDGGTSEGDWHEALNLAAVWKLPVVFIIENNGYGLSTPTSEQYACADLADRAVGYGLASHVVDGNDLSAVMDVMKRARTQAVSGQPVLIEAKTFRMRGHEEASGTAYVPSHLFEEWKAKDPILRMERFLTDKEWATEQDLASVRAEADRAFTGDLERALNAPDPDPAETRYETRVYGETPPPTPHRDAGPTEGRFIDGIRKALHQAFDEDARTLIMGQDIAEYGGAFKVTEGFLDAYGRERVRNTPIIESAAIGAAYGLALSGFRPIVEMQFADFISCGYNQIVQNLSPSRYRWSGDVNVTIRGPHGAGAGAGPFHSQSPESWFMPHHGLKIVVPGTVEDAQLLLYSAIIDPNPVLVFEHKRLYRSQKGLIFDHIPYEPLGRAKLRRTGSDAVIITYGFGVTWAVDLADRLMEEGISVSVLDLRTLRPLDTESIATAVRSCGRVLLLQEPSAFMGPMSEVAAFIAEDCFEMLDAPVMRCSSLETPVPTHPVLENAYLPAGRAESALRRLLTF